MSRGSFLITSPSDKHGNQRALIVRIALTISVLAIGCAKVPPQTERGDSSSPSSTTSENATMEELSNADSMKADTPNHDTVEFANARRRMIASQLRGRDITNARVLETMGKVPRHLFVPLAMRESAYHDRPLPIGHGQTISQPYIVALMTQLVEPNAEQRALDVGTGSGYQAAVLAELVDSVYSIEIVEPLAREAQDRLKSMGYENIQVRHGDGYHGWSAAAPFDVIIVAAAPDHVPQPLVDQLARGGKLVIPVGDLYQQLLVIEKDELGQVVQENVAPVAFVPLTRAAQ